MVKIRVFRIEWDTDGESVNLPTEVVMDVEKEVLEDRTGIADRLSELYGWCVREFRFWEIRAKGKANELANSIR